MDRISLANAFKDDYESKLSFNAFVRPKAEHFEAISKCLDNLLKLSEKNCSSAEHAAQILLSIWDSNKYLMKADNLRALDVPYLHYAIYLLHENGMCRKYIFNLTEDAEKRMMEISKRFPSKLNNSY